MPVTCLLRLFPDFARRAQLRNLSLDLRASKNFTTMSFEGEGMARAVMLNDGYKMPLFGLGVYRAFGEESKQAVKFALQNGYRMIDTAAYYG